MEAKKFTNLSSEYKNFLLACSKLIIIQTINENTSLNVLNQAHSEVTKCLYPLELQISDINHLLLNYSKTNEQVEQLKKIAYYRNYLIITSCLRTNEVQWKNFILKIKLKTSAKTKDIENAVLELLKKYMGMWDTIENIIVIDKKGIVKSVELFDPDDYNFIFNLLKK